MTTTEQFTWVVGLPPTAVDLPQQEFDDLVARRCWEASNAAKEYRARELAKREVATDAA